MNNPEHDRLQSAFDTARRAVQEAPTLEQQANARAHFLAEAQARSVSANGDMRHRDQTGALSLPASKEGERRMNRFYNRRARLIAAVLLGLLLAGGFWASPSLRAVAQTVIDFFQPRSSDRQPSSVLVNATPIGMEIPYPLRLEDVMRWARADLRFPTFLPDGYHFAGARYESNGAGLEMAFDCAPPWRLLIVEFPSTRPLTITDIGASAVIEDVPIRGTVGQYVRGWWRAEFDRNAAIPTPGGKPREVPATNVWDNEMQWHQLVWREDGVNLWLMTSGAILDSDQPDSCRLTKEDFAAIGDGMQPFSTLRD
jgi:hypothetical protein